MVGAFEQAMLAALILVIMLGLGASLTPKDFVLALKKPQGLLIGFVSQFGFMPLIAFLLALALDLPPAYAIGLIIMGAMPGGTTSNMFAYFSRGNLALSMLMTVNSTVFALVMTPLVLGLYGAFVLTGEVRIPLANVTVTLVLLLVPVGIGMLIRRWNANVGATIELFGSAMAVFFILVLLVTWVPANYTLLAASPWEIYAASILLGICGFACGYGLAALLRLHPRNARTVALETGIQNGPLAVAIVLLSFPAELAQDVVFVPALYSLFIVLTSTALTLRFRRANLAAEQRLPDLL